MFITGQKVCCAIFGAGVVVEVQHASGVVYPVVVAFKNNGDENVVCYTRDGKFYAGGDITLYTYPIEIVKAITKPSIDWSHVSSEYNYLIQDSDGEGYLCCDKPARVESGWNVESHYIYANPFTSYVPGTCDWQDSLVKRPELVQEI